jgi:CheY-like chemotaxis protein/DNA-binding XRE family transcriptional regulator
MNNVRQFREAQMLSKTELARRAGVSLVTLDRIEQGKSCRIGTQRKILQGLGLAIRDRIRVFGQEEAPASWERAPVRATGERPLDQRLFPGLRVLVAGFPGAEGESLRAQLDGWGCSLYAAADGPRSLAFYKTTRPDLVLMDANLPLGNGFDASEELMELDGQARIVLLAGAGDTRLARRALESGLVKIVLPKPVDTDQLRMAIQEAARELRPSHDAPARKTTVA